MMFRRISLWLGVVLACAAGPAFGQKKLGGVPREHIKYELGDGVVAKEVTFYSDDAPCWGMIFYPKGFDAKGKTPGVVLAHGWTGVAEYLEKYGNRFAERGLVAMVIDYRSWGRSPASATLLEPPKTTDATRFTETTAKVKLKRTRLIPMKQVEDIRNAISYLQGEPGVDPDKIGIWGSSFAGGHMMTVAAMDSRVKAAVAQVPAISGKTAASGPIPLAGPALADAIKRARTGQGGEYHTGFSQSRDVDIETQYLVREYRPFLRVKDIPETTAVLFIVASHEELFDNKDNAYAAAEVLKGPKQVIELPLCTHFEAYIEDHFEKGSTAAADWFLKYLGEGG